MRWEEIEEVLAYLETEQEYNGKTSKNCKLIVFRGGVDVITI